MLIKMKKTADVRRCSDFAILTIYFSEKFISHFEKLRNEYVVVYDTVCKSNEILSSDLYKHDHEEADTLLILYGIDVAKNGPFVCSPDTDVFLLLISFYKSLCTLFRIGKGNNNLDIDTGPAYEALGEEKVSVLIGFHSDVT